MRSLLAACGTAVCSCACCLLLLCWCLLVACCLLWPCAAQQPNNLLLVASLLRGIAAAFWRSPTVPSRLLANFDGAWWLRSGDKHGQLRCCAAVQNCMAIAKCSGSALARVLTGARARALWSLDRPMSIHHNTYISNRTDHPVSKQRSAETEKPSSPRTPRFSVRPIFEDISCCRRRAQRLRPNGSGKTFMSARRPNVICPGAWPCSLAPPQAQLLQDFGENAPRHAPAPRAARRSPSFCARAFNRSFRKCCAGRRSHRLRVGGSQL